MGESLNPKSAAEPHWRDQREELVRAITAYCGDAHVAEDLVQDALVKASENWDQVRRMDSPDAWLYRVAANLAGSHYRRRRIEQQVRDRLQVPQGWASEPDPALRVALVRALETLPSRQRAVVALRYLLDWSVADVADLLGVSDNTVKSLAHRGLGRLRAYFDADPEGSAQPPAQRRSSTPLMIVVAIGAVLVGGLLAMQVLGGTPPSSVWIDEGDATDMSMLDRSAPNAAGQVVASRCPSRDRGELVLTLADGPTVFALFSDGERPFTCLVPDSTEPGAVFTPTAGVTPYQEDLDPGSEDVIVDAIGGYLEDGGVSVLYAHGRMSGSVVRAQVVLEDGSEVSASLVDGYFGALWASSVPPDRVEAFDAQGRLVARIPVSMDGPQ